MIQRKEELQPKLHECRYGSILNNLIGDYGVLIHYYSAEADYQGHVDIAWEEHGKFYFYEYSYGSCSGCDDWEARGLSNMEIAKEMIDGSVCFSSLENLMTFLNPRLPDNDSE